MFHEPRLRKHPQDYDPNFRGLLEEGLAALPGEDQPGAGCRHHRQPGLPFLLELYLPTICFPAGWSDGLPLAIQLVGRSFAEEALLVAAWCEAALAFQGREVPTNP